MPGTAHRSVAGGHRRTRFRGLTPLKRTTGRRPPATGVRLPGPSRDRPDGPGRWWAGPGPVLRDERPSDTPTRVRPRHDAAVRRRSATTGSGRRALRARHVSIPTGGPRARERRMGRTASVSRPAEVPAPRFRRPAVRVHAVGTPVSYMTYGAALCRRVAGGAAAPGGTLAAPGLPKPERLAVGIRGCVNAWSGPGCPDGPDGPGGANCGGAETGHRRREA